MKQSMRVLLTVALAFTAFAWAADASAQVILNVDYVFPDPITPIGEPDPAVWATSGGLSPLPTEGEGLQIIDPDNNASLLYFHSASVIGDVSNATTFRATAKTPNLDDASSAWSNDTTGFRLILDDSVKRLVLGLGRDPSTHARQVVVIGAIGVAPIPFPWNNNQYNIYEIGRLANGDVVVTVANGDPNGSDQPVTITVPAAALPASTGGAMFAWGMGAVGGGVSFWQEVHGQVTRTHRKILFTSTREGNLEIYSMNPDGTGQTRLTNHAAVDAFPTWSPNRAKIAFTSNRAASSNFDVHLMNADGTGITRLTSNSKVDGGSTWSPDGTKIAFTSKRDGNLEIYVMNADGTAQTRLTTHGASDLDPTWSPDGTKIAFVTNRHGGNNFEIYVMNADGTGQTRLTNHWAIDGSPDWSPDGAKIAFTSTRDGNFEIYSMNASGTGVTRLTNNHAVEAEPAWSGDSAQIAFTSNRDGFFSAEIYVMNANGSGQTRLTNNSALDISPDW